MSGLEDQLVLENGTDNGSCYPYNTKSYAIVAAVSASLAGVSLVLLTGVVFILLLLKKWVFFSQKLILYLTISCIAANVAIILHRVDYQNQVGEFYMRFCQFGGFLDLVSTWMVLMAVCVIISHISMKLFFDFNTEKLEIVYLFFIFIFPFLIGWIPFIASSYGRAGAWCWIRSEDMETCQPFFTGQVFQYTLWFGPLYLALTILIILYILILIRLYQKRRERQTRLFDKTSTLQRTKIQQEDVKHLILYPLFYFLLNIFPFINRTYNLAKGETNPNLVLWYLTALASPLIGPLISIAYCLDPETRKRLTLNHIRGSAIEWVQKGQVVTSYSIEDDLATDSFQHDEQANLHPYTSYQDWCNLNLGRSKMAALPRNY